VTSPKLKKGLRKKKTFWSF